MNLDDLVAKIAGEKPETVAKAIATAQGLVGNRRWLPNEGPQSEAYFSKADVLLYGGQAGGGKTHLELGLGINEFESGIIFRRERTQTDGLEKEGKSIVGQSARFNGQELEWTWASGKTLKLAGMKDPDSWMDHAGRERDYMGFDEGGEFLEMQVAQIIAWLRAPPGKRTRVVIGSNPPRTSDGLWLIKWFAPWLDDKFPERAMPGELRWAVYITRDGESQMVWVTGPGEYDIDGEQHPGVPRAVAVAAGAAALPAAVRAIHGRAAGRSEPMHPHGMGARCDVSLAREAARRRAHVRDRRRLFRRWRGSDGAGAAA
jgi:hypothetical protein